MFLNMITTGECERFTYLCTYKFAEDHGRSSGLLWARSTACLTRLVFNETPGAPNPLYVGHKLFSLEGVQRRGLKRVLGPQQVPGPW